MSSNRLLLSLSFGFLLCARSSAQMHSPATSGNPAFEQLKSLVGTWEGKIPSGATAKLTYEVVSNGSVVMERLHPSNEAEMITMYSLDHGRLVVTHYCSAGNQPTMQTDPVTAATGRYQFQFVSVSGTKTPDEGHMVGLTLILPDKNHLTEVWTFLEGGKNNSETLNYTRKS
jgi:hypothetical protein